MKQLLTILLISTSLVSFCQTWTEVKESLPTPYNQTLNNQFMGYSIASDGNVAVVGLYGYEDSRGIAYVMEYDGSNWTIVARLRHVSRDADDRFGWSVDISGDNIVIGAYREGIPFANSGFAYVFTKPSGGWQDMTETARLEASDPAASDFFGFDVAISGDNIVIGAYFDDDDGSASGSAYVFTKPSGGWVSSTETAKIKASDGAFSDKFGTSVGISGDYIAVGAPEDDDNGSNSGSVYVFKKPLSGWTNMTQTAKIKPSDGATGDFFGTAIDFDNDQLLIGSALDNPGGSAYIFERPIGGWTNSTSQSAKLGPTGGATFDYFGNSLSISGDQAVVGSYLDDDNGSASGSAYVFEKTSANWSNMTQTAKITASDGLASDGFGIGVTISGDNILCGASGVDFGSSNAGSVYAFKKPISGWINGTQNQKITAPTYSAAPNALYGFSVDIDGNYAVVGSHGYQVGGAAFVLEFDGFTWTTLAKLTASDAALNDNFGYAVAIKGDDIVVSAPGDDVNGSNSGSAYVFTKPLGNWQDMTENAKLLASDGTVSDFFGSSVDIDGDVIVVGAEDAGVINNEPGAAYIYVKSGSNWTNSNQTAKLTASDGSHDDFFGASVGISGDDVIIGSWSDDDLGTASGSAYVFSKPVSGWANMTQTAKLNASDGASTDYFGRSVDIYGDDIVIGAFNDDDNQVNSGSAYVFTKSGASWSNSTETAKLNPSDASPSSFDFFGHSVSITDSIIAVGAYGDSDNFDERQSGSSYIFYKPATGWNSGTQSLRIRTNPPRAVADNLGWSIAISGENMIVGAYKTDFYGDQSGSAYFFKEGCNTNNQITVSACNSYTSPSGNYTWTSSNLYTDTILNGVGCDSIIFIDLTINFPVTGNDQITACESFTWIDGNTYTSNNNSATFNIVGGAANGCDSLVTLDLTIINSSSGTDTRTECSPYTWIDGNTYTSNNNSATFNIVGGASNGCDSLVSLDLTILNTANGIDTRTECSPYTWIDGNTYTSSNNSSTFNIVGGASNGCDSLVTLNLTILQPVNYIDNISDCDSLIWIDGNTYTANNNTATFVFPGAASNGCDSIVNLNLTISNTITFTDVEIACDSFTWIDGLTYTANNSTSSFTYSNGANNGCDSIVFLDLTILNSTSGIDSRTECDSFTWIDGNTYTSSTNSATFNIIGGSSNGCDSLVTLDLTILNSSSGTDTRTECSPFVWIDGNTYTSNNNTASFNIIGGAANGCDSIVTLDLTILNSASGTDTRTECSSYTWIDGNTYTSSNNSATFNIVGGASNGCDSLVTLDLTIINVDVTTTSSGNTISANNVGAVYQWLDCDNAYSPIPGETNRSFTAQANGDYAVEITESNCIDTSSCINISGVGLTRQLKKEVNIYPNPFSDNVRIEYLNWNSSIVIIELFDQLGRLIFQEEKSTQENSIDFSNVPSGIYTLKINDIESSRVVRIVKK